MPITVLETVISTAGILVECLLVFICVFRNRHRRFWFVMFYALYHLTFSAYVRLLNLRMHDLADVFYYADDAIDFFLLVGVIAELFFYTVVQVSAWLFKTRKYLVWGLASASLLAGTLVMSLSSARLTRSEIWDYRLDLFTSLLLCTLLIISAWTTVRLRVHRSAKVKGIGRGIAIWASVALIVDLCHMNTTWFKSSIVDEISNASWVLMLAFWAYNLLQPEQSSERAGLDSLKNA